MEAGSDSENHEVFEEFGGSVYLNESEQGIHFENLNNMFSDFTESENFTTNDIAFAEDDIKPSKWPQALTRGPSCVGGVSGGSVSLNLYRDSEDSIQIQATREDKEMCSGQMYLPVMKQLVDINLIRHVKSLASIPASVQSLLCRNLNRDPIGIKKVRDALCTDLQFCRTLFDNTDNVIEKSNGANSFRMEFYFKTFFESEECDIAFPSVNIFDFLIVSYENMFLQKYSKIKDEAFQPLYKVFVEQKDKDFDCLGKETKAMLVLCSEMVTKLLDVKFFTGKIMNQIEDRLRSFDHQGVHFYVPEGNTCDLSERDQNFTGLTCGLVGVLELPEVDLGDIAPFADGDNVHLAPSWVQMYQPNSKGLVFPTVFQRMCGTFHGSLFSSCKAANLIPQDCHASIFDDPPISQLSKLSVTQIEELVHFSCKLVIKMYRYEWRGYISQRTKFLHRHVNSGRPAAERTTSPIVPPVHMFPTTFDSFREMNGFEIQVDRGLLSSDLDHSYVRSKGAFSPNHFFDLRPNVIRSHFLFLWKNNLPKKCFSISEQVQLQSARIGRSHQHDIWFM